jgi:hypothetical protein
MRFLLKSRKDFRCSKRLFFIFFGLIVFTQAAFCADEDLDRYDSLWIKRNAVARLQILSRAVNHYATALRHYEAGDYRFAERFVKDALRVEPRFPEALLLQALIFEQKGDSERSIELQKKAEAVRRDIFGPVLEEQAYLAENIERLKGLYSPSLLYKKVVLFLLLSFGVTIFFAVLVSTNFFMSTAMRARQVVRVLRFPQKDSRSPLIIDRFPGEEKECRIPWPAYVISYGLCFAFAFGVVSLFDFDTRKEMVFYGFFTGSIISFLVYHIFFNETEFEGPSKFSKFR